MSTTSKPEPDPRPTISLPERNELCSLQARKFLRRHFLIFDLFYFGVDLASRADDVRRTATEALAKIGDEKSLARLKEVEENPNPAQAKLNSFANLQSENIVIRVVDNFLSYLSEIIQVAIKKQPKILMSEETIKVEDVLRFSRYSDLVSYLVEKKINDLSYSSIRDVEQFMKKRTGIAMFESDEDRTLLVLGIELRNIYTHNRGVVSETTMRKLSNLDHHWDLKKGKRFGANYDEVVLLANNVIETGRRIDESFAKKFSIRRKRYIAYE